MCVSLQLLAMAQSVVTEKLFSVNSFENGITVKVN